MNTVAIWELNRGLGLVDEIFFQRVEVKTDSSGLYTPEKVFSLSLCG